MKIVHIFPVLFLLTFCGCVKTNRYLEYALEAAGDNRGELEYVLDHYKHDPEKLYAATFLIENMPGHESYSGHEIDRYYDAALQVLKSDLTPKEQRDSILKICERKYRSVEYNTITDLRVIKSDYLIYSIDHAFEQWKSRPWAQHITLDEFCEWILPYKVAEMQSLDQWRDTLMKSFGPCLDSIPIDDDQYGTVFYTVEALRNGIIRKMNPVGMFNKSGYPLLRSDLLLNQTYGRCEDYVNLAVMTYRSLGIPAIIDETPFWGRYRAGHCWYVVKNDRGEELKSEWDVSSVPGNVFFQDKRIPKVLRHTYSINRERAYYKIHSKYKYPFDLCRADITDQYFNTSDIDIPVSKRVKIKEKFAYIATFTGIGKDWNIVDFGTVKNGVAHFTRMGRNVLYIALGYDGKELLPISEPFILKKNGDLEYITNDWESLRDVTVKRKYFQSNNVVMMRKRILGGKIHGSDYPDFRKYDVLYSVENTDIADLIELKQSRPYRYVRFVSPPGSYGSLAELAFFDQDSVMLGGTPIGNTDDKSLLSKAFDHDWLTNYETEEPDGNWVGLDLQKSSRAAFVRIVPRGDDNDIHPGDEYELKYWDGIFGWVSRGTKMARGNELTFDSIPRGALIWVHDKTQGWDERPFLVDDNGNVEWW